MTPSRQQAMDEMGLALQRYQRSVQAFDEAGLIGEGEHTRAVIDTARLLSGAENRRKPVSTSSSQGIP